MAQLHSSPNPLPEPDRSVQGAQALPSISERLRAAFRDVADRVEHFFSSLDAGREGLSHRPQLESAAPGGAGVTPETPAATVAPALQPPSEAWLDRVISGVSGGESLPVLDPASWEGGQVATRHLRVRDESWAPQVLLWNIEETAVFQSLSESQKHLWAERGFTADVRLERGEVVNNTGWRFSNWHFTAEEFDAMKADRPRLLANLIEARADYPAGLPQDGLAAHYLSELAEQVVNYEIPREELPTRLPVLHGMGGELLREFYRQLDRAENAGPPPDFNRE